MSHINIDDQSLIPTLMGCIKWRILPTSLSHLKNRTFITKIRVVCHAKRGTDPLTWVGFTFPPNNHPCGPMPTTDCFIFTLIGKWDDIKKWNYSALQYTVSHIHDNDKNDQATIDALQEMGRHINVCFTHPIAQEMINTTNGGLSSARNTITFGLVINVDNNTNNNNNNDDSGRITYINPCDPSKQHTADNPCTTLTNTPSIGWLCLFVISEREYWYHLPIVDLSLRTKFMKTRKPDDLPPAEAFAYNALIDKWKHEKCIKELSSFMPKPNQLNPYTYLEAWCDNIKQFHVVQQKQKEQEEAKIKARVQECFDEYKRLSLQQQTLDITSHIQQCQMKQHGDSNNDIFNIDPSLITTLSSTLYNEYYANYLSNQLNDLKIIDHLQYHQYQQLSDAKLCYPLRHGYIHNTPRNHIALPSTSTASSTTSSSQIDTLIELAATITPTQVTTSTLTSSLSLSADHDNIIHQDPHHHHHHQQQDLAILHHQYNILDEQKHILTIQYDELSTLLQSTIDNKDNEIQTLEQQISQMEKEMVILNNKIITLQQQITTSHDELIATKEQYEDEITILKEECHRKELNAVKEAMASAYINIHKDTSNTTNTTKTPHNIIPPHINNQISFLQQQLQSKDQQLQSKDEQIKDIIQLKDQQLQLKDQQLQSKDEQITSLQEHHHQQFQEIIQSKDKQHQQQLESKDKQLEAKDHQLQSRDKQIESKDQQIAALMQMVAELTKK